MTELAPPRTPDPAQAPPLRWGVMGTGWIVERFVGSVRRHTSQRIVAVASRDGARARAAAAGLDVPNAHEGYAALAADAGVDVVYVGTGHREHVACARTALEAGKHVLVEKPMAMDAAGAEELVALARDRGLFLAEAMWTFFLPRFDVVRQVLDSGVLGEIRTVLADNGEHFEPDHRILRADLDGGPMLDLGSYPIAFATWVLGEPQRVTASAVGHPAGVVGQVAAVLTTASGAQAVLHTSVFGDTPVTAAVCGTEGMLLLDGPFYQPGDVEVRFADGRPPQRWTEPRTAHDALFHEAVETARCIDAGATESPLRPWADTIATLRVMDAVREKAVPE